MNTEKHALNNEQGSVIVVVLLLMVILTLVGLSANRTTITELKIAGNEQARKMSFNVADGGLYPAIKLIGVVMGTGDAPDQKTLRDQGIKEFTYKDGKDDFIKEMMKFTGYDYDSEDDVTYDFITKVPDPEEPQKDSKATELAYAVGVDIRRMNQAYLEGGGVEFGSGAEGVGAGTLGGIMIVFDVVSTAEGPMKLIDGEMQRVRGSKSRVDAVYRKVNGIPGGL